MKQIYSPNLTGDDVQVIIRLPRRFARGGLARAAESVRKAGRYGDNVLVHMNKDEFEVLKSAWGDPTYHPHTGMPEYFSWGDVARGLGDYATGNWGDMLSTAAGAIGGALDKKATYNMANQFPAPPIDPNLSTHLGGNAKNARTTTPQAVQPPQSYYTRGQYPEQQAFKNNSMAALTNTPGAQVQPLKYDVPGNGSLIAGALGGGALNYALTHAKDIYSAIKGAGSASSAGSAAAGAGEGVGMSPGALTALTGEGNSAASGAGAGLLPGSTTGSAMVDTGVPINTLGTLPAEGGGAGAGTGAGSSAAGGTSAGAAAAGVGSFLALAALGKHLQDNTAGLGYNESRQLASGLAANAAAPDPPTGRGQYANTPMPPPPQGFKTWNQYFYATQMIQQAQHASGGAKDQGTYRMLLQEAGLPSDPSFYMQTQPGQDIAWQTIMGHNGLGTPGAANMHGKARGGLAFAEGGTVNQHPIPAGPPPPTTPKPPYNNMDFCDVPGKPYKELCQTDPVSGKRVDRPGFAIGGPVGPMSGAADAFTPQLGRPQFGGQAAGPLSPPPAFGGIQRPPVPNTGMPPQGMPPLAPRVAPVPPPTAAPPAPGPMQQANPALFPGQPQRAWGGGALARAFGGPVHGPGTGTSDDIPARLSNGEYVIPAHVVAALGDGSTMAGAKRLDELQRQVRMMVGRQMASNRHPKPSPPPLALMGSK